MLTNAWLVPETYDHMGVKVNLRDAFSRMLGGRPMSIFEFEATLCAVREERIALLKDVKV